MSRRLPVLLALSLLVPAALLGLSGPAAALDNGLASTPPMGWNDWNAFGCGVDEQLVEQTADAMVSSGMRDAGYRYVNIDDCWALPNRDAAGELVPDPAKFPHGIAALADHVHARGLKLGIYQDAGVHTCSKGGGFSGSLGHERQDAMRFAAWHVDYIKYDDCNVPADGQNVDSSIARYVAMRDALAEATAATGQTIVFSVCEKGDYGVPNSAWPGIGNLWRTTYDIHDNYGRMVWILHQNVALADLAGPNRWNDPDMLEVGNGGMTDVEYRSHFALWAEMAAPLIAGTDLRTMSPATREILTNRDLIAVDQDPLGAQGRPVTDGADGHWALSKPLADGSRAVTLFNETDAPATISTTAAQLGLAPSVDYQLRDLWTHTTTESAGTITDTLPAHGSASYRVTPSRWPSVGTPPHVAVGLTGVTDGIAGGTTVPATVTLVNDGRLPALFATVDLRLPDGWAAQPQQPAVVPAIPPGGSRTLAYQLVAAAPAAPLPTERLGVTAAYHGVFWTRTNTATFTQEVRRPTPVQPPYRTFAAVDPSVTARFGQLGGRFAIEAAGSDVSGANDQYGTVYLAKGAAQQGVATVRVAAQQARNAATKSGLVVRADLTRPGSSPGYVTLAVTPAKGVQLQWDADGNGQLDSVASATPPWSPSTPIWLRLTRNGTSFTGQYSADGGTWTTVAAITVPAATGSEDVGVFTTSHSKYVNGRSDFDSFTVD
ncbi:alpha-galactosidase [Solihabitans fulvus]|uniref:Alpha-galactosidase n=1 Tax=Solihabitans fulvus TaxID=1892852 RepID=A0A5B2W974_9PSEU|nr:NEW3 domain-containing protein [Solihabitans fulvus]KAA2247290.1 alpha-galactosidase [Solihabitans fulvus]